MDWRSGYEFRILDEWSPRPAYRESPQPVSQDVWFGSWAMNRPKSKLMGGMLSIVTRFIGWEISLCSWKRRSWLKVHPPLLFCTKIYIDQKLTHHISCRECRVPPVLGGACFVGRWQQRFKDLVLLFSNIKHRLEFGALNAVSWGRCDGNSTMATLLLRLVGEFWRKCLRITTIVVKQL